MVMIVQPFACPLLPSSLRSPEDMAALAPPPAHQSQYAKLNAPIPEIQTISVNSLVSLEFPPFRSFLPLCSFVTQKGYSDVPIPTLVDFIVATRSVIPEFEDYSKSLLEPLTEIQRNPGKAEFAQKSNRLFVRGSCLKSNGLYSMLLRLETVEARERTCYDAKVSRPRGVLEVSSSSEVSHLSEVSSSSGVASHSSEGKTTHPDHTPHERTVDCVCDNRCGRYYVSERWRRRIALTHSSPFNSLHMFASLLTCRYALFVVGGCVKRRVVPDTPEMTFLSLYLVTGTVVFLAESPNVFWWSAFLKPNVHYIPVKVAAVEGGDD